MHVCARTRARNNTQHPLTRRMFIYAHEPQTAKNEKSSHLLVQSTAASQLQSPGCSVFLNLQTQSLVTAVSGPQSLQCAGLLINP